MRELFKIVPQCSQDQPVPFHPYHLRSCNRTPGITPGTVYLTSCNTNPHHSSLLQDLSEGIWNTLLILEGSDMSDPIPSLLYSTTDTMHELHADPTSMCATSKVTLLPSEPSSPSTPLPSPTLSIFPTIFLTITQPITMMSQPVVPHMPAWGDCGSPEFGPEKLRELRRFFEDLKFQFTQSHVVDEEEEMKQHALQFIDCDTVELWEILPKFADMATSYQQFVDAVYKLYLGLDAERRWSIGDMEKLVGEVSRVGISSLADLGKSHREFIAMTTFPIMKNCISAAEQSWAFTRGFPQKFWTKVAHWPQLKFPNHFPTIHIPWSKSTMPLMSLPIRYSPMAFYFWLSIVFFTPQILRHASHWCNPLRPSHEPSRDHHQLYPIPIAPSVQYHIGDLPYDLQTTLLYFPFLVFFLLPNTFCHGPTNHRLSHCAIATLPYVSPHTNLVLILLIVCI